MGATKWPKQHSKPRSYKPLCSSWTCSVNLSTPYVEEPDVTKNSPSWHRVEESPWSAPPPRPTCFGQCGRNLVQRPSHPPPANVPSQFASCGPRRALRCVVLEFSRLLYTLKGGQRLRCAGTPPRVLRAPPQVMCLSKGWCTARLNSQRLPRPEQKQRATHSAGPADAAHCADRTRSAPAASTQQ